MLWHDADTTPSAEEGCTNFQAGEQAAVVLNAPNENFIKRDTVEIIKTVTGDLAMVFMSCSTQVKSNPAV